MKIFSFLLVFLCAINSLLSQTVTREIYNTQLGNKKIYEITAKDSTRYYEFYYKNEQYHYAVDVDRIFFEDFESLKSFFVALDSLYNEYNPSDTETVTIDVLNYTATIRWSIGVKFIYVYSDQNDSFFSLTKNSLKKINYFLDKYAIRVKYYPSKY